MLRRFSLLLVLVCLAPLSSARADGGTPAEASKLRDASVKDWEAGRYGDAADKLRRAADIYQHATGSFASELAITWRALVWNLVRAGDAKGASDTFLLLFAHVQKDATLDGEMWNAYGAMYEAAKAKTSLADCDAVLRPLRAAALVAKKPNVASQVLHDLASLARDRGEATAGALLEEAVSERRASNDRLGLAWSLNNLANLHLKEDRLDAALAPLLEAHRLVIDGRLLAPQAAIAVNLSTALERLAKRATTAASTAWLRDVAEASAKSDLPSVLPADALLRRAAKSAASAGKPAARTAAQRLAKDADAQKSAPPEVRVDLHLRAARLATENGGAEEAAKALATLAVGKGPCAPHLAARLHVERARAAAELGNTGLLAVEIREARAALLAAGDRPLREEGLSLLLAWATKAGLVAETKELGPEYDELRRSGHEGGFGGSAKGGGDRGRYGALGFHDPVFAIDVAAGKVRVRDLLTGAEWSEDLVWQPRHVAIDGLSLTIFGGYVKIDSYSYGPASATTGGPAEGSLDELDFYRPLPEHGVLRVLKNGAVDFAK